jgi:hypothetical protein
MSGSETITSLLARLSESAGIPLSTLKSGARVLKELGLLNYGGENGNSLAEPTRSGSLLLSMLADADSQSDGT